MKKTTIKAVDMVRRIRDAHYEQLRGKSPEERIAFYRAKAAQMYAQIMPAPQPTQSAVEAQAAYQCRILSQVLPP